jgi:shikimate dehydrogenase
MPAADTAAVLTLNDLATWDRPGTHLAVLGQPIKHSISPAMHNAALAELARSDARFADWCYHRFEVLPEDLPRALDLLHARGFRGVNLTVPHKIIAAGLLPAAAIAPEARPIGAVNTLRHAGAIGWTAFNTDGPGLAAALRETLGRDLTGADVILLGAGGAARGAAVECVQRGCRSLHIANRTRANLDGLLALLRPLASAATQLTSFDPAQPPRDLPPGALVINATSAGLRLADAPPLDLAALPTTPAGVYDMIYNPPETRLLAQARALGLPLANGLSMLVHQGARSLELWTGGPVPVLTMAQAATTALGR